MTKNSHILEVVPSHIGGSTLTYRRQYSVLSALVRNGTVKVDQVLLVIFPRSTDSDDLNSFKTLSWEAVSFNELTNKPSISITLPRIANIEISLRQRQMTYCQRITTSLPNKSLQITKTDYRKLMLTPTKFYDNLHYL